jgi:hypothetical protein
MVTIADGQTVTQEVTLGTGLVRPAITSLRLDISGFKYDLGGLRGIYVGAVDQAVTDDDTSYVYLDKTATLQINTTGFPSDTHIPLAKVVAANGEICAIYEARVLLASSSGAIGTCSITLPVDGDVRGGDTAASSNNNWAAIRYDASGTAGEARNRLVRKFPKNYVSGDLVVRVIYSFPATIGNNKDMFWRLSYKFASVGDALGTMASVTTTKECDGETADTLYSLDLTIPEANVDSDKDFIALYIAREYDNAADTCGENCYVHNVEIRYTGRQLAGQAGQ